MVLEYQSPGKRKNACHIRQKTVVLAIALLSFFAGCQPETNKEKKVKKTVDIPESNKTLYQSENYTSEGMVAHAYAAATDQHGILHVGNYKQKGQIAAIMDTVSDEVKATLSEEGLIHALVFSHENEMVAATEHTLHHFNQRVAGSPVTFTMLPEEVRIQDMTYASSGNLYVLVHDEEGESQIYHVTSEGKADLWATLPAHYTIMKWSDMHKGLFLADTADGTIALAKVENEEISDNSKWVSLPSSTPGGLAVDSLGGVFVTIKKEGKVVRYDKKGKEDRVIELNDTNPGAIVMGGGKGRDCFVLTEGSRRVIRFVVNAPGQEWVRANY